MNFRNYLRRILVVHPLRWLVDAALVGLGVFVSHVVCDVVLYAVNERRASLEFSENFHPALLVFYSEWGYAFGKFFGALGGLVLMCMSRLRRGTSTEFGLWYLWYLVAICSLDLWLVIGQRLHW